ncbi:MAG: hypothetical protein ACTSVZ_05055, partial [Promethearchaeota archaeon]
MINKKKTKIKTKIIQNGLLSKVTKVFLVVLCISAAITAFSYLGSDNFGEMEWEMDDVLIFNIVKESGGTGSPQTILESIFNIVKESGGTGSPQTILESIF